MCLLATSLSEKQRKSHLERLGSSDCVSRAEESRIKEEEIVDWTNRRHIMTDIIRRLDSWILYSFHTFYKKRKCRKHQMYETSQSQCWQQLTSEAVEDSEHGKLMGWLMLRGKLRHIMIGHQEMCAKLCVQSCMKQQRDPKLLLRFKSFEKLPPKQAWVHHVVFWQSCYNISCRPLWIVRGISCWSKCNLYFEHLWPIGSTLSTSSTWAVFVSRKSLKAVLALAADVGAEEWSEAHVTACLCVLNAIPNCICPPNTLLHWQEHRKFADKHLRILSGPTCTSEENDPTMTWQDALKKETHLRIQKEQKQICFCEHQLFVNRILWQSEVFIMFIQGTIAWVSGHLQWPRPLWSLSALWRCETCEGHPYECEDQDQKRQGLVNVRADGGDCQRNRKHKCWGRTWRYTTFWDKARAEKEDIDLLHSALGRKIKPSYAWG